MVKRKCFVFEPGSLHIARICLKMGENIFLNNISLEILAIMTWFSVPTAQNRSDLVLFG